MDPPSSPFILDSLVKNVPSLQILELFLGWHIPITAISTVPFLRPLQEPGLFSLTHLRIVARFVGTAQPNSQSSELLTGILKNHASSLRMVDLVPYHSYKHTHHTPEGDIDFPVYGLERGPDDPWFISASTICDLQLSHLSDLRIFAPHNDTALEAPRHIITQSADTLRTLRIFACQGVACGCLLEMPCRTRLDPTEVLSLTRVLASGPRLERLDIAVHFLTTAL